MIERSKDILYALLSPYSWISLYKSCPFADGFINKIIDDDLVVDVGRYVAKTSGGAKIWIANYPYAYGELDNISLLPYRRTRARLRVYIAEKRRSQFEKRHGMQRQQPTPL